MFSLNKHMGVLRHVAKWLEDEGYDNNHVFMDGLNDIETDVAKVIGVSNEVIHTSRPTPTPIIAPPAGAAADAQGPIAADFAT